MNLDQQDELRRRLIAATEEKGWSYKTLAKRAGVGKGTIYNFLSNQKSLGELTIGKLARALGMTPEALQGIEDEGTANDQKNSQNYAPDTLSQDEIDALTYLRRLSPARRHGAVRVLRELIETFEINPDAAANESRVAYTRSAAAKKGSQ